MPEKTSTSSPNSRRRCSESGPDARVARLVCPADLPGLTLSLVHKNTEAQPRHAHDSFIVGVVTAGTRRMETARGMVLVQAGEVFVLPPGTAHLCMPEQGPCSYLVFSLETAALPERLRNADLPLRIEDAELTRALLHLAEACETKAGALERQSLLACALERLGGQAAAPSAKGMGKGGAKGRACTEDADWVRAVRKAMDIMEADPGQSLSLPALAEACGADMYALHRAFTRLVGLPPHAFQTHRRLRRAKALLRAGASLTDAALAAGFCDQSHMHRHFTRLVGFTPAQYASAHKARGEQT